MEQGRQSEDHFVGLTGPEERARLAEALELLGDTYGLDTRRQAYSSHEYQIAYNSAGGVIALTRTLGELAFMLPTLEQCDLAGVINRETFDRHALTN